MMSVHTLPLGDYQTNTYLVSGDNKHCAIIDPGFEPQTILDKAAALGWDIDAILLTHGHFDHVGGVEKIVAATCCALWLHKADWALPGDAISRYFYPIANRPFSDIRFCAEGEVICAGGLHLSVLSTPGHTQGSVCYLCGDALFSGDTLFAGSCGRTDLPGGDWNTIVQSLHRLATLEGEYTVYPGHGGSTTLSHQRQFNPYMR